MPTNTVRIDNKLLQQAVQVSGLATKREVVESALRLLISLQNQSTPATTALIKSPSRTENYHPEVVKMLQILATEEPITPPQDTEEFLAWLKQDV